MGARAQHDLEHYQNIDQQFLQAISRAEAKTQETLVQKRHQVEELINLENLRSLGSHNAATAFGQGYSGFGNGWTEAKPRILYPKERKRPRRHLRECHFSRKALQRVATLEEVLVPIRLDIDYDKYKLRDTFTWNSTDDTMSVELFAEHLCEDYSIPQSGFMNEIIKSLRTQLTEHYPHRFPDECSMKFAAVPEQELPQYTETRDDDLRVPIKLDITVGSLNLIDQIEWDINNPENDPERYALHFCAEVGLSCEFQTAIAHAIREQCQLYTKSLFLAGHAFDGTGVQDSDLRQVLMPPIYSFSRPKHHMDQFAPVISDLVPEQLERIERDREREGRRNRRQTRGKRGVMLPDLHDLPKTYRSFYANTVLVADPDQRLESLSKDTHHSKYTNDLEQISDDERWHGIDSPRHDRGTRSTRNLRAGTTSMNNDNAIHPRPQTDSMPSWTTSKSFFATADSPTTSQTTYIKLNHMYDRQAQQSRGTVPATIESRPELFRGSSHPQDMLPGSRTYAADEHRKTSQSSTSPGATVPSLIVKLRVSRPRFLQLLDHTKTRFPHSAAINAEL